MALIFLFFCLLILIFGLMIFITRPSQKEKILESRLQTSATRSNETHIEAINILKSESYSDVPWLNSILVRLKPSFRLRKLIADADQTWSVGKLVSGSILGAVAAYWLVNVLNHNKLIAAVLAIAVLVAPYAFLMFKRQRRLRRFAAILPDGMDLVARALRAGHSLTAALDMVGQEISDPVGREFRRIFEEQNLGLPLREALLNLAERVPLPDVRFMVAAMLIQRETGGNLVEVLDKTTSLLRERARLEGQIRVHTAQGRLTGWILCLLPFIAFFAISWVNPEYMDTLIHDSLGQMLLVAGACLMVLGILVIRKIVDIKV